MRCGRVNLENASMLPYRLWSLGEYGEVVLVSSID